MNSRDQPARYTTMRQKAVAVLLQRANASFHDILRNTQPDSLGRLDHPGTKPVPVKDVVYAINFAGQWPPNVLRSPRLPRSLTFIRQTTALLAIQLSDDTPRSIARTLGSFDRSTVLLGAKIARRRIADGDHAPLDLLTAALVILQRQHPGSHAKLDEELQEAARITLHRHIHGTSISSRDT